MKKETIKQILTIIFAVALLSAVVGFVGLVVLNFRFESTYYFYRESYYDPIFTNKVKQYFQTSFLIVLTCMSIAMALAFVFIILSLINFKSKKTQKIVKILNLCLSIVAIVLSIVSCVQLITLNSQILPFFGQYLDTGDFQLASFYDSFLSQLLSMALPLIIASVIAAGKFVCDLKKKKSDDKLVEKAELEQ